MPVSQPVFKKRILLKYRKRLQRHLKDYINSLTVHGVSRVLTGTILERLFWALVLVGVFAYFFITAHTLLSQFTSYSFITNYEVVEVENINLPSITVCDHAIFTCSFTWYRNGSKLSDCNKLDLKKLAAIFMNSIFCYANGTFQRQVCNYEVSPHYLGCIVINAKQSIKQESPGRRRVINFGFKPIGNGLHLFLHHQNDVISWSDQLRNYVSSNGHYDVILKYREINRLPSPFHSNCITPIANTEHLTFPYSKSLCQQQCLSKHMFYECGVVGNYWLIYLPTSIQHNTTNNSNNNNNTHVGNNTEGLRRKCVYDVLAHYSPKCKCRNLCKETDYESKIEKTDKNDKLIVVNFYYDKLEITKSTELPAYDRTRFMADIGGLAGLMIGMSMLSVFEVVVCCVLYILDFVLMLIIKFY